MKQRGEKGRDTDYKIVNLSYKDENNEYKSKNMKVHRAVASEFKPNDRDIDNNIDTVDHLDGDKTNNNVDNLEWVTTQENIQRARINGLMNRPLEDYKLLLECIVNDLKENKMTLDEIANKYNVSKSSVFRLKHGSYNDIVGDNEFAHKQYITDEILKDIYVRSHNSEDWNKLAKEYDLSWHTIRQIYYAKSTRFEEKLINMGLYNPSTSFTPLSSEQIIEIRKKCDAGVPDSVLMSEYNRSETVIRNIRLGKDRYKDILENAGFKSINEENELSDGELLKIYQLAKDGMSDKEIADKFNVHQTTIVAIRTGSKYKYLDFLKRYNLNKIMIHNRKIVKENKFSEEEAIKIYNEFKNEGLTTRQMGARYGCDKSLVANIKFCRGSYSYLQDKYGLEPLN